MPRRLGTLKAWTQAKDVAKAAYRASMEKPLVHHFALADQIRIAFASACELSWHLEMAHDMELLSTDQAQGLQLSNELLISLLVGLIKKLAA